MLTLDQALKSVRAGPPIERPFYSHPDREYVFCKSSLRCRNTNTGRYEALILRKIETANINGGTMKFLVKKATNS